MESRDEWSKVELPVNFTLFPFFSFNPTSP